ncbi:hypothetical protein [Candidatus Ichthyocystis sparus]|nr:hypothetical protein [Candidatus Ichthyocystis sparus]
MKLHSANVAMVPMNRICTVLGTMKNTYMAVPVRGMPPQSIVRT